MIDAEAKAAAARAALRAQRERDRIDDEIARQQALLKDLQREATKDR